MKKIITSFIILFSMASANSQSIQLFDKFDNEISGDTLVFWHAVDSSRFQAPFENKNFLNVFNNTSDTVLIDVTRVKLQGITGAQDQLCWGTNCYVEPNGGRVIWEINDPVKTNPMDTAAGDIPIAIYLDSQKNSGEAYFRYDFVDTSDTRSTSSITVNYSLSYLTGLSEEEISQFGFDLFPNPANESTVLKFKTSLNFREQYVEVLDITGKRVSIVQVPTSALNFELNTEAISSGVYFVRLVAEGVQVETKKIIIE